MEDIDEAFSFGSRGRYDRSGRVRLWWCGEVKAESDELVAAVRANGVPVEYIVFADEGHGFQRRETRIEASEAYARFLTKHLGEPRAVAR